MMNQVQIQLPTTTTSLNGYHHHHLNGHTHSNNHRNNIASYIPHQTTTNGVINYQNNVTHIQHQIGNPSSNPSSNHSSPKVTYQQFATSSNATTIIQNPINTNPVTPANPLTNSKINISQSPSPLPTQSVTPKIDIQPVTPSQHKNSQNAQPENETCCGVDKENTENITPSQPKPTDDGKAHCNQEKNETVTKPTNDDNVKVTKSIKDDKGFDIDALQEEIENMEEEEKRKLLIDNLYKLIKEKQPMLVSKITGMIIHEQSNEKLLALLIDPNHEELNKKIDEAVDILTKDEEKGGEYYVIYNGISNCNNTEEKLKYFRDKLYPMVEEYVCVKSLADDITELLLSLDICELFVILDPNEGDAFKKRMDQAIRYYVTKNKEKNNNNNDNNNNPQQKGQTNGLQNPLQQTQTMPQTQPQQQIQQTQQSTQANNVKTGSPLCHSQQSVVQHQHITNQQQQTVLLNGHQHTNGYQHTNGHQIQQQQPITNGVHQVQLQQTNLLNSHNQQTNVHHNHLIQQRQQQMQQVVNHTHNGYVQQQLNAQQLQRIQQLRAQQLQAQQQMKVQQQQQLQAHQLQAHQLRLQQQQNMNVNVVRNGHHLAHQVNGYHAHQTAHNHIQHVQHVQRAQNGHVYQNGHVHHQRLHSNIK